MNKQVNIPKVLRIDGNKFYLWESGPKYLIDKKKIELQEFNRLQVSRGFPKDKYKYRVFKYGNTYAIYHDR